MESDGLATSSMPFGGKYDSCGIFRMKLDMARIRKPNIRGSMSKPSERRMDGTVGKKKTDSQIMGEYRTDAVVSRDADTKRTVAGWRAAQEREQTAFDQFACVERRYSQMRSIIGGSINKSLTRPQTWCIAKQIRWCQLRRIINSVCQRVVPARCVPV
jgi:hypothetical protein